MPGSSRLRKVFTDIATHPAVWLGAGNTSMTVSVGTDTGVAFQAGTLVLITGFVAHASWHGYKPSLPYYALSAVNVGTAGLGLEETFSAHGFVFSEATRPDILGNAAIGGWGIGHFWKGRRTATGREPPHILKDSMVYYGGADMAAVAANPAAHFHPVPFGLAVGGFVKALFNRAVRPRDGGLNWHATPARIYGPGYLASGVMSFGGDPFFTAAYLLWGTGVLFMDEAQNAALRRGAGRLLRRLRPGA